MRTGRREFLLQMSALGGCATLSGCRMFGDRMVGLPVVGVPSYWCTWCQEVALAADKGRRTKLLFPGDQGTIGARDTIDERSLFGPDGWARFYPRERGDLLLVIDDGWDVPYGLDPWSKGDMPAFGSLEPDARRFPSFGKTSIERLAGIVGRAKDLGWKGLGIWVACQCPGESGGRLFGAEKVDEWLKRKLDESARAGVAYWKVDWGVRDHDAAYRVRMTELKRRFYPELVIEHMPFHCAPTLPEDFSKAADCPFNRAMAETSDVIRTYDVQPPLNRVVTLRRIAEYSRLIDRAGSSAALNVEDEVIIGATLNHAIGIMRGPDDRAAETCAAVAWQHLAPAVGARPGLITRCSVNNLTESHAFGANEAWYLPVNGRTVAAEAPAIIARGLALPEVRTISGETPFVVAGRHPNGFMAVAQLPRHIDGETAMGAVEIDLKDELHPGEQLAVFGCPSKLRVPVSHSRSPFEARDLSSGETFVIRDAVHGGNLELTDRALQNRVAVALRIMVG